MEKNYKLQRYGLRLYFAPGDCANYFEVLLVSFGHYKIDVLTQSEEMANTKNLGETWSRKEADKKPKHGQLKDTKANVAETNSTCSRKTPYFRKFLSLKP